MEISSIVPTIISISSLIFTGLGFLYARFQLQLQNEKRLVILETNCKNNCEKMKCLDEIKRDLGTIKGQSEIFWRVIEPHLAQIIHSPTHKRRDELVDKLVEDKINLTEAQELTQHLELAIQENHVEGKKLAAALLLVRTKNKINEIIG
jgi:hypothetical protein